MPPSSVAANRKVTFSFSFCPGEYTPTPVTSTIYRYSNDRVVRWLYFSSPPSVADSHLSGIGLVCVRKHQHCCLVSLSITTATHRYLPFSIWPTPSSCTTIEKGNTYAPVKMREDTIVKINSRTYRKISTGARCFCVRSQQQHLIFTMHRVINYCNCKRYK
jgi:hypothetical protein